MEEDVEDIVDWEYLLPIYNLIFKSLLLFVEYRLGRSVGHQYLEEVQEVSKTPNFPKNALCRALWLGRD